MLLYQFLFIIKKNLYLQMDFEIDIIHRSIVYINRVALENEH